MASWISRYNRQELLSFVGKSGQQKLKSSSVAVVGMGALGTVAAEILARAGVGRLVIIDRDIVELTDLQRQLLYDEADVGKPKVLAAAEKLKRINSEVKIIAAAADVDYKNIKAVVGRPDVVLDCTDNLETRFLINEYCLKNKLAWVHAAAIRETAQLMAFDFRKNRRQPCFACVFGKAAAEGTCDTVGVLSSATAAIAAMQAAETIKILVGQKPENQLMRLNIRQNTLTKISVKAKHNCISQKYEFLNGKKRTETAVMCGKGSYQIKGEAVDVEKLKSRLQRMGEKVVDFGGCISFRNITLFKDGRALIKADSAWKARADYSRLVGM